MLEHILELNKDDNTGARYLLTAVYLYSNQLEEAERIIKNYGEEDAAAAFAYDRIVLEFKKNGITSQLKNALPHSPRSEQACAGLPAGREAAAA
ncbi:hypothetical protein ACFSQ7_46990 [Paenibacillus rhizoplanae]